MTYETIDGCEIGDHSGLYFMIFTAEGWIDVYSRKVYRDLFLKNMNYCREHKSLSIGNYVIMTNYIHVIWQAISGRLSDTVRNFKSFVQKNSYQ